jgi:hypothetical protein
MKTKIASVCVLSIISFFGSSLAIASTCAELKTSYDQLSVGVTALRDANLNINKVKQNLGDAWKNGGAITMSQVTDFTSRLKNNFQNPIDSAMTSGIQKLDSLTNQMKTQNCK